MATSNLLATPRDALTFLYPCLFRFQESRATYGSTHAQASINEQAGDDKGLSADLRPRGAWASSAPPKLATTRQPSGDVQTEPEMPSRLVKPRRIKQQTEVPVASEDNLIESLPQKDTPLWPAATHNESLPPLRFVQTGRKQQKAPNPLADDGEFAKPKSLKEALQGPTRSHSNSGLPIRCITIKPKRQRSHNDLSEPKVRKVASRGPTTDSIKETLQLKPTTVRRLRLKAEQKEELWDKTVVGVKGSWSYDWRLPLEELKQRFRDDGSDAVLTPLDRPYLLPKRPKYRRVRAQDIPVPAVWSPSSFAEYIQDLTQSEVSRVNNRHIYNDHMTHVDAVHGALLHVFGDMTLRPHFTPKAFDTAFVYFYKHLKISNVRRLFNLMNELYMEIPTETFNVILKGAAARKDLHHLTFILRYMARKGVSPNAESWVALLRAVQSNRAKLVIYQEMKVAGALKNPTTLQNAVMEMLDVELPSHITSGQELAPFLEQVDTKYGPNWLSLSAVNHLCHRLGESGLVSQALEFFKFATDRNIKPDSITLHIFLCHSLRLRRPKLAIQILELFHSKYHIRPNEAAYDILFMVAFRSQRLNLCKVIWRYACLHGAVSFRMHQIVTQSLLRNTPEHPKSNLQRWMKTAGKSIVGIDLGLEKKVPKPLWHPTVREIIETLSKYSPRGDERKRAIRLAKKVVERDVNAWRRYVPRFTLLPMLKSALWRDSQWEEERKRDAEGLWKVEKSIRVQIRVPSVREIKNMARIERWKEVLRN